MNISSCFLNHEPLTEKELNNLQPIAMAYIGDTIFDMYSLAVCMWGIAIPLALLGAFVFHWPVLCVYACTCLDEVGKLPWVMLRLRKYKWVQDLTR